ncbi:MAG: GvpL/GvpF family gas vesicle protein [Chloroflexi bacterium]|nr:GvpL/GvpF family gas vesicle protein [Chloroflexota bacterium]
MIYLYAITDHPDMPVPHKPGLADANGSETRLYSLACRDIAVVVSTLATTNVPPTETNLWRHEAVVESLMPNRAVLPMRFGTVLPNDAAVQVILSKHYPDFVASLGQVRGRVELGLRVLWQETERQGDGETGRPGATQQPVVEGHGHAYMMARLEEERQHLAWRKQAEKMAAEIHDPLAQLAAESTNQVLVTSRLLLTAAYLVERDQVQIFQRAVDALSTSQPALRFLCTGPWPPYNFVTAVVPKMAAIDVISTNGE